MPPAYSKSLLKAYVEAYIHRSQSLTWSRFTRARIARGVYPKQEPQHAKSHFSAACSTRSARPLTPQEVEATLRTCRELLADQYRKLGDSAPEQRVNEFERQLCHQLRLSSPLRVTTEDFRLTERLEGITTPARFGLPDIAKWETYPFDFSQLVMARGYSIEVLEEITQRLATTDDVGQRISLLHSAICAAALHYPGSPHHARALDLSLEAADLAKLSLLRKSYHTSDEHRLQATDLGFQLNYLAFRPLLDSPVNYLTYALSGRKLPDVIWRRILGYLNEAILFCEQLVEIDSRLTRSWVHVSSSLSMKARMLLVAGGRSAVKEADALHRESIQVLDKLHKPYGMAYPIVRDIVLDNRKGALRKCQESLESNEAAGVQNSAAAFAALFLQLSHAYGGDATGDQHIRNLARHAVNSPEICYSLSHVFDAKAVRKILEAAEKAAKRTSRRNRKK